MFCVCWDKSSIGILLDIAGLTSPAVSHRGWRVYYWAMDSVISSAPGLGGWRVYYWVMDSVIPPAPGLRGWRGYYWVVDTNSQWLLGAIKHSVLCNWTMSSHSRPLILYSPNPSRPRAGHLQLTALASSPLWFDFLGPQEPGKGGGDHFSAVDLGSKHVGLLLLFTATCSRHPGSYCGPEVTACSSHKL